MIKYYYLILFCLFFYFLNNLNVTNAEMTEKQMKAAAKLMRNACQPKHKATDEMIEEMHKGIWNEDPAAKCYMHCVLVMMKVMKKNGDQDWNAAYAQIDTLPEARHVPTKASMDKCKDAEVMDSDKCDNSWRMARCIYFDNPPNYFLP